MVLPILILLNTEEYRNSKTFCTLSSIVKYILLAIPDRGLTNLLGFLAPRAPVTLRILCDQQFFISLCIYIEVYDTFCQCYGVGRVSPSSQHMHFFDVYLYLTTLVCWMSYPCMGSNADHFEIERKLQNTYNHELAHGAANIDITQYRGIP